jgi:hypothetical protein
MKSITLNEYYQSNFIEDEQGKILCQLLNPITLNLGIEQFSLIISNHVGKNDLKRLIKDLLVQLVAFNAFILEDGSYLTPAESLEMLESVLYLEILYSEFQNGSGRRSFFLANYKSVSPQWIFFCFEFLLSKQVGYQTLNLLAYHIGTKKLDLGIISKWTNEEKIKTFISLSRVQRICVFQDEMFIGFKFSKKINDAEMIIQVLSDEISMISDYCENYSGTYFDLYGELAGSRTLVHPIPKPIITTATNKKNGIKKELTPLEMKLKILKIKELPSSLKELKKIFFNLANETHPDKFASIDKGTKTEFAIMDKFREVYDAYELVEKEILKSEKK